MKIFKKNLEDALDLRSGAGKLPSNWHHLRLIGESRKMDFVFSTNGCFSLFSFVVSSNFRLEKVFILFYGTNPFFHQIVDIKLLFVFPENIFFVSGKYQSVISLNTKTHPYKHTDIIKKSSSVRCQRRKESWTEEFSVKGRSEDRE